MIRQHIETMFEMRRIASSWAIRGDYVMAQHARQCAIFHERKARYLIGQLYGES